MRPLAGSTATVGSGSAWRDHAAGLLSELGATVERPAPSSPSTLALGSTVVEFGPAPSVDADWATSGAMALTGDADDRPLLAPAPVAAAMRGAAAVLALLTSVSGRPVVIDGPALLGERAALAHLGRRGQGTPGGHGRLIDSASGWFALSLPRREDRELVPALLGADIDLTDADAWAAIETAARERDRHDLVDRARLLGLPAAIVGTSDGHDEQTAVRNGSEGPRLWQLASLGSRDAAAPVPFGTPLVVDLSSLWAGPLCAQLLGLAGARLVKVEDPKRPDGGRAGPPAFFDLLCGDHASVTLDRTDARLAALVDIADIVITSSRPTSLEHRGLDPRSAGRRREPRPAPVWISVTGYGATGPWRDVAALGDDAAAAAGLLAGTSDRPVWCGDAIADPLCGLHAAVAAVACRITRTPMHVDVSLREVAARVAGVAGAAQQTRRPWGGLVARPRARPSRRAAPHLGADTEWVLHELLV